MKLRVWTATVLFLSGYFPLAVMLGVLNFDFDAFTPRNPNAFGVTLAIGFVAVALHIVMMRRLHGDHLVEVVEVEDRSPELLNYTVPYIASFVGQDILRDVNLSIAMCIFLALLCTMTVRSRVVLINPLLVLTGYKLYGVRVKSGQSEFCRIVISKTRVTEGSQIKVCPIGNSLLFGESP